MMTKIYISLFSFLVALFSQNILADESHHHHHASQQQSPTIKIDVSPIPHEEHQWKIKITQIKDNKPVTLQDLKEVHTEKVHLLIIDNTLEDYSHIHPRALKEPGTYQFAWQPKPNSHYFVWADLFPLATQKEEYVVTEVLLGTPKSPRINNSVVMENTVEHYHFKLKFDKSDLKANQADIGTITITDEAGKPVEDLQPIMGAFAHIVGFSEDLNSIVHIHPMGAEPTKATDRGGPSLKFHINPDETGFIKLFVQVKIKDKEIFVPFGLWVK